MAPVDSGLTAIEAFLSRKKQEFIEKSMAKIQGSVNRLLDRTAVTGKRRRASDDEGYESPTSEKKVGSSAGDNVGASRTIGRKRVKKEDKFMFACPFYKHDPVKYSKVKTCCGPGWDDVHRVK